MTCRSFVQPPTLLFFAIWLVLLVGGRGRFFQDSDTFWHTVVGQKILDDGFFDTDPFSFTRAGEKWIPHQWLGEVLFALVHSIGGLDTLLLFAATLLAGLFTWLGVRLMRCGLHPALTALLVGLAMAASAGHFHIRPHLATMIGFAMTMAFLCDFEARRISLGRLAWLIPVYLVWSNLHGGMLGGLATFALAIFGWSVTWKIGWNSPVVSYRQVGTLGLIWLGCAVTAFVNPYGARLPEAWLSIYQMQALPKLIKEHSALHLQEPNAWMVLLLGGLYVSLLATSLPRGASGSDVRFQMVWLLPLVWFALSCDRVRHAPLFAIAALIALADFFPRTRLAQNWQRRGSDLFVQPGHSGGLSYKRKFAGLVLPLIAVGVALGLQATHVTVAVIGHDWARLDPQVWPMELMDELKAHEHDRPGGPHIFNEYSYGGFLIYHAPGYRIFVDGRSELYGDAWLAEFLNPDGKPTTDLIARWELQYGPFDFALVGNRASTCYADHFRQSPDWLVVKSTETAILFQRKSR